MFLNGGAELGGAERSLLDILASVRAAEPSWPLHLLTGAEGPLIAHAAALGVATSVLPLEPAVANIGDSGAASRPLMTFASLARLTRAVVPAVRYVSRLRAAIAAIAPDVVHTNSLKMHLLGGWAAAGRTPIVWHLHDYIESRPLTRRLLQWNARRPSVIVANSDSVAGDVRHALGLRTLVIRVHNAVDLERFSFSGRRLDLDAAAGLPPAPSDAVRVGLLGTFGWWKGHTTFLDAIARLPRDLPVRAYVIGGPLYQSAGSQHSLDYLRGYADARGLTGRVGFTGFVPHPEEAIRSLDVVVHASTAPEPFGLVIAEAMACSRAVIASDAGGAREIFTPGIDALAHTPGDPDSLASRIEQLARDPEARRRLGRAGRRTAERRFDRARLAADFVPVYRRAIASA